MKNFLWPSLSTFVWFGYKRRAPPAISPVRHRTQTTTMNWVIIVIIAALTWASLSTRVGADTICPGAPLSSYGKGHLKCDKPVCTQSLSYIFPSLDPTKFYRCAGSTRVDEQSCADGTCFSEKGQGCVFPRDWVDECIRSVPTTTTTTEATKTTTSEATTTTTPAPIIYKCPGASDSQHSPGHVDCKDPGVCNAAAKGKKRPTNNPREYFECNGSLWTRKTCQGSTCFDYANDKCLGHGAWRNSCKV